MKTLRIAGSVFALALAILPLLSAACGTGTSCLRLSDCADGLTCQAGQCAPATPAAGADANAEASSTDMGDANAQAQDSTPVDAGSTTTEAGEATDADHGDADTENDAASSTEEPDAG